MVTMKFELVLVLANIFPPRYPIISWLSWKPIWFKWMTWHTVITCKPVCCYGDDLVSFPSIGSCLLLIHGPNKPLTCPGTQSNLCSHTGTRWNRCDHGIIFVTITEKLIFSSTIFIITMKMFYLFKRNMGLIPRTHQFQSFSDESPFSHCPFMSFSLFSSEFRTTGRICSRRWGHCFYWFLSWPMGDMGHIVDVFNPSYLTDFFNADR